jgi:hypothetical protein
MAKTLLAPPEPPGHDDLEALIEEARRRTRLRRLSYAAAALFVVLGGAAVWGGIALTNGSTTNGAAPPGYHLVQARGDVEHQVIETRGLLQLNTVDLATGRQHRRRGPRSSGSTRVAGWRAWSSSWTGECSRIWSCRAIDRATGSCVPGYSFATNSPVDSRNYVRDPGTYRFHGREVIWAGEPLKKGFGPNPGAGERVGIDVRTHEPIAYRYLYGDVEAEAWVTARLRDVPASQYSFVVPDGDIVHGFPKQSSVTTFAVSPEQTLLQSRTRRTLGRTPLWLGRMFAGQPLQSIALGAEVLKGPSGESLSTAPFVRYDYGALMLLEFGARRPSWYRVGPRPGQVVLELAPSFEPDEQKPPLTVQRAALTRNGVLVLVSPSGPIAPYPTLTRARLLRLVDALRPVPR